MPMNRILVVCIYNHKIWNTEVLGFSCLVYWRIKMPCTELPIYWDVLCIIIILFYFFQWKGMGIHLNFLWMEE